MSEKRTYTLLFAVLGAIFFIPFLGGVHLFDWDEINFAEISREMIVLNDYLRVHVDFKPFWEKPPFFFWMQAGAMQMFGINEFSARLPNAICGILTIVLLYLIGRKLNGNTFGLIWAGTYFGTILPHLYFRSGIIDPWFNLFIFLGLYLFIQFSWKKADYAGIRLNQHRLFYLLGGGFVLGLAIITKGPAAYLIVVLCLFVYWLYRRFNFYINVPQFLLFSLMAAVLAVVWLGTETILHGTWFVEEFTKYQYRLFSTPDAGHGGFPGYHFVVLLIGCFPASVFCLRAFGKMEHKYEFKHDFFVWMLILFWVVLILFTIVKSKIIHYSSLAYFPLTYLAAEVMHRIIKEELRFSGWMKGMLIAIGSIFGIAVITAPFLGMNIEMLRPLFEQDPFAMANLNAAINWTGWEIVPGILLLITTIAGVLMFSGRQKFKGFILLYGGTAIFVFLTLIFFIKKIEGYSQRAAISFFESKVGADCYIAPIKYKTYAHLFYTQKQPVDNAKSYDKHWLLNGDTDKEVYVITKINKAGEFRQMPGLEEVQSENGFVMFRRK